MSRGTPATVRERVAAEERPATNGHMVLRPATNGAALPAPKPAAAVRISNVTKRFGRNSVFADINFSVAKGELVEITGPSGAGKTPCFASSTASSGPPEARYGLAAEAFTDGGGAAWAESAARSPSSIRSSGCCRG